MQWASVKTEGEETRRMMRVSRGRPLSGTYVVMDQLEYILTFCPRADNTHHPNQISKQILGDHGNL